MPGGTGRVALDRELEREHVGVGVPLHHIRERLLEYGMLDRGPLLAIRPLLEEAHEAVSVGAEGREGNGQRGLLLLRREREECKFDRPPRPRSLEEDGKRADPVPLLDKLEHAS